MNEGVDKLGHIVVSISREHGSQGREIGRKLSEKLKVSYYDREILKFASEQSGINEAIFGKYEEKDSFLYKIAKKVYNGELIPPGRIGFLSDDNLFNYQAKVVKELAEKESFVIIGQCGGFVLDDMPKLKLLKVFVTAKKEDRIQSIEKRFNLSLREIEKLIEKTDKQRAGYFQYHTGEKWHDIRNYDVCINTSKMTVDQAVGLLINYVDVLKSHSNIVKK